jgi:hypothetical protein
MNEADAVADVTHKEFPSSVGLDLNLNEGTNGKPFRPTDEDGRTLFDTPSSDDGSVVVVFPKDRFAKWRSQALVHIHSSDGKLYLAQVAGGPYAAPNGLPAQSPLLVATQIEGTMFTPPYHGWVELTILGEVQDGNVLSPLARPHPNSPAKLLTPEQTRAALKCDGDLRLGRAVGHPDLHVGLDSKEKHHIPRHTLVVGTTGAGKSTCMAGLVEKLAAHGFCVLILDVEGEYTTINEKAGSAKILPALAAQGLQPKGLDNTFLLIPTETQTANPEHPSKRRFCLEFANISPHVAVELLQGNEAQSDRFLAAYDAAGELFTQLCPPDQRANHQQALQAWDDQETGYPGLRLAHVLDMAQAATSLVAGDEDMEDRYLHETGFRLQKDQLLVKAAQVKKRFGHTGSLRKTVGLIGNLYRSRLFDRADGKTITSIDYAKMIAPGRVLIFDLQGLDSPQHRNLAISDVLRGVTETQEQLYANAAPDKKPKTVILIEEAHEFVSAERIKQMPTLFNQIQRIARRGRKRWLGLMFATQFPQHLPGELFSLCNNRILLRLGDEPTINRLKHSVGGVSDSLWGRLKNLPTGHAIVSAQGIDPAMIVALEPGRCKLRMVD